MTILKFITSLFLIVSISHAELDSIFEKDEYVDMDTLQVRQDKTIQFVNSISTMIPAITFIQARDGRMAVILSLNTPEYQLRDNEWNKDFRVVYQKSDGSRIMGELDGESFSVPGGQWVSSLSFLPTTNLLKEEVKHIIIQAKRTEKRSAYIEKLEQQRIKTERLTNEMLPNVPFPKNTLGELFDFTLNLHDGSVLDSKQNRGKVILINFWSWYCGFCKKAMPELKQLYEKFPKDQFEILGIISDDYENIDNYIIEQEINWLQWLVNNSYLDLAINKKLNIQGVPFFMLIDQSGKLVKQGYSYDFDFNNDIQSLLE